MHPASRALVYALFGVAALVGAVFLLALGPLGWAFLVVVVGVVGFVVFYDAEDDTPSPTNCPACGAPNDAAAETCDYCGKSL